jgi:hypothetical protein
MAKMKAEDVLTPLTSIPAMTSGRTSPMTTSTEIVIRAPRLMVKSAVDNCMACITNSTRPARLTAPR